MEPDILDIKYFHSLNNVVSKQKTMFVTESPKYRFFLPVNNRGGYSMEWYYLVSSYKKDAAKVKEFLENLADTKAQWKFQLISEILSDSRDYENFQFRWQHINDVLESILIENKQQESKNS